MAKTLADFYDEIHEELQDDIPMIVNLAQMVDGAVLELGCGTGRILRPLITAGITVTGVDNDEEMLGRAKPFVEPPSQLILQDFTALNLGQTYDLIVLSHNTLMHVPFDKLTNLFAGMARHLNDGGMVLIDTINPHILIDVEDSDAWELERELSGDVKQWSRFTADHDAQIIHVHWRFDLPNDSDKQVHEETIYHYHLPHTLQQKMKTHDLIWEMTYGDYEGNFFDQESDNLIIVAKKR